MTEHHDHRSIVHPPRPTVAGSGAPGTAAPPRLLVPGNGDGISPQPTRPR